MTGLLSEPIMSATTLNSDLPILWERGAGRGCACSLVPTADSPVQQRIAGDCRDPAGVQYIRQVIVAHPRPASYLGIDPRHSALIARNNACPPAYTARAVAIVPSHGFERSLARIRLQ